MCVSAVECVCVVCVSAVEVMVGQRRLNPTQSEKNLIISLKTVQPPSADKHSSGYCRLSSPSISSHLVSMVTPICVINGINKGLTFFRQR